jgi:putative acetyltransferase
MVIRQELTDDIAASKTVHRKAFPTIAEADLLERLRADGDVVFSFVAADGDDVVGHVVASRMTAPFRALGLGPVAVIPAFQGRGVGSCLIKEVIFQARRERWDGIFVLGAPAYYIRFGFCIQQAANFTSPFSGPHFMALSLQGESLPASGGAIGYAPAFDVFAGK